MNKKARILHKWIGLISFIFIIIVSSTAFLMNHQEIYFSINNQSIKEINLSKTKFISISPKDENFILASDYKSLFKSIDTGKTWKELKLFIPSEKIDLISFSNKDKDFFAVGIKNTGIYITDDGGDVWEELQLPFSIASENIQNISFGNTFLLIKTEYGIYKYFYDDKKWDNLKFSLNKEKESSTIKETIYDLHTGKFFGSYGTLLYDLLSIFMIILSISGIILSFKFRKKVKIKKIEPSLELVKAK